MTLMRVVVAGERESILYDIPAQSLESALSQFALQSKRQVLFDPGSIPNRATQGLKGEYTAESALEALLEGTGLGFQISRGNTIVVTVAGAKPLADTEALKNWRLVQADGETSDQGASQSQEAAAGSTLEEVVVTAQKRQERLLDVPVPVTALTADALVAGNQVRLQDYYSRIPGVNLTTRRGGSLVSIRGLSTGSMELASGNPTVSTIIDDAPYGSSSALAGGGAVPDIDPNDLARVEVLRGPQGTLYGASSIGGLIKFVTLDPSTEAVKGRIQLGMSSVRNGNDPGYNARGSINVPLSDTWAIRASAYTRRDPGYIDNIRTGEKADNSIDVRGGHLSVLWRPSDVFSLKLGALLQNIESDGSSDIQPELGDLKQDFVRGTGKYDGKVRLYSATANARLGNADLTSVSSYSTSKVNDVFDLTFLFGEFTLNGVPGTGFDGFGVSGTPLFDSRYTKKFTQEVRATIPVTSRLDWLLGGYYTDEDSRWLEGIDAVNDAGEKVGSWQSADWPTTYSEYAAFTDLTVKFTDSFDVQFGARKSWNRQSYSELDDGIFQEIFAGHTPPVITPKATTKDSAFTYLVTPRLRLSDGLMLYARLASGYRPGGPNSNYLLAGALPHFKPDKTRNYEIGIKGDALEHTLSFDASVYYIDWKDIQISLINPVNTLSYTGNASRAKSQGVEFSVEARPVRGFTAAAWVAWNDAVLTEKFPDFSSAFGASGDRLPDASRISGSVSLEQQWPLTNAVTGMVGGSLSYIGNREGNFTDSSARQQLPGFARVDLRAGINFDAWAANLFVMNLTDRRGVLTGGLGTFNPAIFSYIQPRTIGLSVSRDF